MWLRQLGIQFSSSFEVHPGLFEIRGRTPAYETHRKSSSQSAVSHGAIWTQAESFFEVLFGQIEGAQSHLSQKSSTFCQPIRKLSTLVGQGYKNFVQICNTHACQEPVTSPGQGFDVLWPGCPVS